MIFFLIVPVWVLCIFLGTVLVCLNGFRRAGIYLIAVSTGGTLLSFCLSTAILFLGPRIGLQHFGSRSGVALSASYVLAAIAGGVIGSVAGFSLTRKLLPRQ